MWGCRVGILRSGVFDVVKRRGRARWYSSSDLASTANAKGVSDAEFLEALEKVYSRGKWDPTRPVGLAISGGVDSMALAQLYSRLHQQNNELPKAHGIIIDHRARPESTEEARWVAEQLRSKLNISSSIVPLVWPKHVDISRSFETNARRLRYQALGMTCKEHHIDSLFVAHHGDDQAETVMMRLMKGRFRSGLQGIQGVEWIPECHGMHGIHHSGEVSKYAAGNLAFPIESGGIQILRPLLSFEKSRLIATCKENDIPWAEDATNADPTLTTRNAVRHILKSHTLPTALSKPALISLAQNMQSRIQNHRSRAEDIFNNTDLQLDIRFGAMTVHFPRAIGFTNRWPGQCTKAEIISARNTAHLYLQRITKLISPKEDPSVGELSRAIDTIWPELCVDDASCSSNTPNFSPFCIFGILFRRRRRSKKTGTSTYLLSRQPPTGSEKNSPQMTIFIEPSPSSSPPATAHDDTPQWHLFDNRFWLRITNRSPCRLRIRFLEQDDLPRIEKSDPWLRKEVLSVIKPPDIKLGIPAVFKVDASEKEEFVCFPTLDLGVRNAEKVCAWEVRYRKVDLGEKEVEKLGYRWEIPVREESKKKDVEVTT